VEVRRAIELSFGVVSGVGPGIHVLDGSPRASWGRGCFLHSIRHFSKFQIHWFEWRHGVLIDDRLVCEKLTIFPYADYIAEFTLLQYSQVQNRSGGRREIYVQNVTQHTRHVHCDSSNNAALRGGHILAWPRSHCQHARAMRSQ